MSRTMFWRIARISTLLIIFALAMMAASAKAEWKWQHFGADPYATSRDAAMETRENAFQKLGFPEQVVPLLMEETKKPGTKIRLTVGDKLSSMLSHRGTAIRKDVIVAFGSPVKGMEYAAPAEEWQVAWEGAVYTVILPEVCYNWSAKIPMIDIFASAAQTKASTVVTTSACPNGYSLIANVWSLASMPEDLRKRAGELVSAAEGRDSKNASDVSAYKADDVSRTIGARLRKEVKVRSKVDANIAVYYVRIEEKKPVAIEIGTLKVVNGMGTFNFPSTPSMDDPRKWIVETIWPASFVSPTTSGGARRLWLFPEEWGKFCTMNEHGIVP